MNARRLVPLGAALALFCAGAALAGLREDLARARDLFEAGRRDEARSAYAAVLERRGSDNDAREALYNLALLDRDGQDYLDHLTAFLDRGGRRDRRAAEVELRLGRGYFAASDYRNALPQFEAARTAAREPALAAEARLWVGRTLLALREFSEAAHELEDVAGDRAAGGLREQALYTLAELQRTAGNAGQAARAFEECRRQFPDGDYSAAALFGAASTRELLGDARQARELYAELVRTRPATGEAARAAQRLREMEAGPAPARARTPAAESDAAVGPPATRESGATAEAAFEVQVGAFASEENATKLADDLTGRGYPRVRVEKGDGDDLYHVRFGGYEDRPGAEQAGERVSAELGLSYTVRDLKAPR